MCIRKGKLSTELYSKNKRHIDIRTVNLALLHFLALRTNELYNIHLNVAINLVILDEYDNHRALAAAQRRPAHKRNMLYDDSHIFIFMT